MTWNAMEVIPGERVGSFILGLGINDIFTLLKNGFLPYRPRVNVLFESNDPLSNELILEVPNFGLCLKFEPKSQRLLMIEIFEPSKCNLSYGGTNFGGENMDKSTLRQLYNVFGPTFPGKHENNIYQLCYRGISFYFPYPNGEEPKEGGFWPFDSRSETSPGVSRIVLYQGLDIDNPELKTTIAKNALKAIPDTISLSTISESYLEEIRISTRGAINFVDRKTSVHIGCSVQDLVTKIGYPSTVYFKHDNRMKIHAGRNTSETTKAREIKEQCFEAADYFYNYFEHGFDCLIDRDTHTLKKFIIHGNVPGHVDFSVYNKCRFTLEHDGEVLSPDMTWKEVETLLGPFGQPMIHDTGSVSNPFGGTFLYACEGCVFEVLRSGHITTVTVF